jgi:hypothetical protein
MSEELFTPFNALIFVLGVAGVALVLAAFIKEIKLGDWGGRTHDLEPKGRAVAFSIGVILIALAYLAWRQQPEKEFDVQIEVKSAGDPYSNVFFPEEKLLLALKNVEAERVLWIVDETEMIHDNHEHKSAYTFKQGKNEHRIDAFFKIGGMYEAVKRPIMLEDRREHETRFPVSRNVGLPFRTFIDPENPTKVIDCVRTNNGKEVCEAR